jgi:hypothetical protein
MLAVTHRFPRRGIFLNELCFGSGGASTAEEMLPHVLSTLSAIRTARGIRNDIILAGESPLSGVAFGNGRQTLAGILRGVHIDEWRFIKGLEQSSPWDAYPHSKRPGDFQEVTFRGRVAIGMLWAKQNGSAVLSFKFVSDWATSHLAANYREMDLDGNVTSTDVTIPNLAAPEHVAIHENLIATYGHDTSRSSVVHEGDGFVVRMFFNDHDPPHFHVLARRDASETVARYAIETLDVMSGVLTSSQRRAVEAWAASKRNELLANWARCREGKHPFSL